MEDIEGIIWNPNMFDSNCISFLCLLLKQKKKTLFEKLLMILLLIVSLSTGSKICNYSNNLSYIFKYGFSFRNVFYSIIGVFIIFMISNIIWIQVLNRLSNSHLF